MTTLRRKETNRPGGGKAIEYFNATGKLHRVDGPAVIGYHKDGTVELELFFIQDKLHREDGAASIRYYNTGQIEHELFYLDGVELTSKEFLYKTYINKLVDPVSREQATQLAEQAGWNITAEQLNTTVGLTLEKKPTVKLVAASKINTATGRKPN